jgi:hypothetical protein
MSSRAREEGAAFSSVSVNLTTGGFPSGSRIVRACGLVVVLLVCAGAVAGSAAAAGPPHELPAVSHGNDGLARALESGRLSEAEYALERVRSITEPVRADLLFGEVDALEGRDATIILRDLAARLAQLPPAERAIAERLLARPTSSSDSIRHYRAKARHKCGPRICVHWVEKTSDAPSLSDRNHNRIPDWVDKTRKVMGYVWSVEVSQMGYRSPRSDRSSRNHGPDGKLDVYIADVGALGLYGYCTSDDPARGPRGYVSAYCVVDNNFSRRQFGGAATGVRALQVTAAHEFFHAIQYAYDWLEDLWLMEGTASWVEDEVYDTVNDNRQYLRVSPLATQFAWLPLDHDNFDYTEQDAGYHYGVWIFWRYVAEHYGRGVVRRIWKRVDSQPGALDEYSAEATVNVLDTEGADFGDLVADFGVANLHPAAHYSEGSKYQAPGPITTTAIGPSGLSNSPVPVAHLSNAYYNFTPSSLAPAATLTFTLSLPGGPVPSRANAVVTSGGVVTRIPAVQTMGVWKITVPNFGSAQKVTLVLSNGSTRYHCWRGDVYSCRGEPLDDVQYAFSAAVS